MLLTMIQTEQTVYLCTNFKEGRSNNCSSYAPHVHTCSLYETAWSFINSSDVEEAFSFIRLFKITHGFSVLRSLHVK